MLTVRIRPAGAVFSGVVLMAGLGVATALSAQQDEPAGPRFTPLPAPSLNFYGSPGLIDMPSAQMLPEGQFTTTLSTFAGQSRYTLTFQPTPWMSASFRYNGIRNLNLFGFSTYYDRSFDVRFRLMEERGAWPGLAVGLQDFAGTGIYSGEYVVATRTVETAPLGAGRGPGQLRFSAGLGWGRLGSYGSIATIGNRPGFNGNSSAGGELSVDQWFRGPVAPFAGIEWQATDRLGLKLEYSSDAYTLETTTSSVFQRRSPFSFGAEYQATRRTRLGAYYLYGSEIGLSAQFQLNPYYPPARQVLPAPQPVRARPEPALNPAVWATGWAESRGARVLLADRLQGLIEAEGLVMESLDVSAGKAELRFRNPRYFSQAVAIGRVARAMAAALPASVETFRLVPVSEGMGLSAVTVRRSDLEALEFDGMSTGALLAVTGFGDAASGPSAQALEAEDLYPDVSWAVLPYITPAYFDPQQPIRADFGAELRGSYRPAPGWVLAGTMRHRLAGNVADGRLTVSALPPVRTDQARYAQFGTTLNSLYLARYWRPGPDLYARASGGYFEYGYGGLSGEVLWKPVSSLLALGVEANYAIKRDFDQRLGFQDYRILTGHASAYMDFDNGFHGHVDVGRYLAGDWGATFGLDRVFNNGWSVGGFFTLTNVSASEFGEGSFDKGIRFSIPLNWLLAGPSRQRVGMVIKPIQRDGGARLHVPGRLYGQVRDAHRKALADGWHGVWE